MYNLIRHEDKITLEKLRDTYGDKNQILVSMEELSELSAVLAKYPRYEDSEKALAELQYRVLDEIADVYIILDHVQEIFKIPDSSIEVRIVQKINRAKKWLDAGSSMQNTIDIREVEDSYQGECLNMMNKE